MKIKLSEKLFNSLLNEKNSFNIGDYIKIYEQYNIFSWYSPETFEIIGIEDDIIYLDRNLPPDGLNIITNKIHYSKVYIDISYTRMIKIKKIKERCLKEVIK